MDPFLRFGARFESYLVRLAILGLVVLVMGQAVMADPAGRWLMTFGEPLEGRPEVVPATAAAGRSSVVLVLEGREAAPGVFVRVNGTPVAAFNRALVHLRVNPGDVVSIDARCCPQPHVVKVLATGPDIVRPFPGQRVRAIGTVVALGRIEWRNGR